MPTKVLVLHGYSQNGVIFSKRIGALRKECGKDVEFVFADAPHVLKPADFVWNQGRSEEALKAEVAANEASMAAEADPSLTPRAWWNPNPERTIAYGLTDSVALIMDLLKREKFDGVFGFSQGASFAAVLSVLLEKPELYPEYLVDGKPVHPPFKFCVAVSGFKLIDPFCEKLWEGGYSTPTLHVLGKTDVVVSEQRTMALVAASNVGRLEVHPGGHFVPTKGAWRKFLAAYLKDPTGQHPSPGSGDSDAASESASTSLAGSRSETPAQGPKNSAVLMKL